MTLLKRFLFPLLVVGLLASSAALSGCDDDNIIPSKDLATGDEAAPPDASAD